MALRTLALSLLASAAVTGAAHAQQVATLVGDRTIAIVDAKAKKVTRTMTVSGIDGRLAGVDVRPADGMLYGVAEDGKGGNWAWLMAGKTLHAVDLATGKATKVADIAGIKGTVRDIAILPGAM